MISSSEQEYSLLPVLTPRVIRASPIINKAKCFTISQVIRAKLYTEMHGCSTCFLHFGCFFNWTIIYTACQWANSGSPFSPTPLLVSLTRLLVSPTPLTALLPQCLLSFLTASPAHACPCSSEKLYIPPSPIATRLFHPLTFKTRYLTPSSL
jgi:hypothetical protein